MAHVVSKRKTRNLKKNPRQLVEKSGSVVYVNLVCLRRSCEAEYQVGASYAKEKGAFQGKMVVGEEKHLEPIRWKN